MNIDAQIEAEIANLREHVKDTQELYREVCAVLFFRHGITPTANKLYQYVRKGSMSAPADALAKFWGDLREKSRVRIEHPDLPTSLKTAAGDLVATLWNEAQAASENSVEVFRSEARNTVLAAETRVQELEASTKAAMLSSQNAIEQLHAANTMISDLEKKLAGETATRSGLEVQVATKNQELADYQLAMNEARRDFGTQLDKLRSAQIAIDEHHQATEARLLSELDRERVTVAKHQKELQQLRTSSNEMIARHEADLRSLQDEIGAQKKCLGNLEGELREVTTARNQLAMDLAKEREVVLEVSSRAAAAAQSAESWQQQAREAQSELSRSRATKQNKVRKSSVPLSTQAKKGRDQSS